MSDSERRVAKITGAHLGWEDHGIFTCWIDLDYGGSGQGAGLYALDEYIVEKDCRVGTAEGMEFIMRLLKACGVGRWEDLVGRTVYATATMSKVLSIEPLPTESGEKFVFEDVLEAGDEREHCD
jgi:hypothetical protein